MHTPPVRCKHTRLVRTDSLKPHPDNPNEHPPAQLRIFQKIIEHTGWRRCITVSKRSGRIIRGHGAWETARAAGWAKVPIEEQDYADAKAELADLLADNQLARYSYTNAEALQKVLGELGGFDLELAGILAKTDAGQVAAAAAAPPPLQILITCQSESHQVTLLRQFTRQGLSVRAQLA